jgi:hypothetical protein
MMGMNKRGSTGNPEQMVFTNSFALESMIQACRAAKDEGRLVNAINRLKSFVTTNKVSQMCSVRLLSSLREVFK